MFQRHRNFRILADLDQEILHRTVGEAQLDPGLSAWLGALVLDAHGDGQRVADDAVARRAGDHQPAVLLVPFAGQQDVRRTRQPGAGRVIGNIVDLPVGQHDDPGQAARRDVGQQARQGIDGPGALVGRRDGLVAQRQLADFQRVLLLAQFRANLFQRFRHARAPFADSLARRFVHHDRRDILQRVSLFLDQRGVGQRAQDRQCRQHAPARAARPEPYARQEGDKRQGCQDGDGQPGQQRGELYGGYRHGCYCPSRSRMAGTCTWSDL